MALNTLQKLCRLSKRSEIFVEIRGNEVTEVRDAVTVRFAFEEAAKRSK